MRGSFWVSWINRMLIISMELDAKIGERVKLERYKKHNIDILVDEVEISDENISKLK